MNIKDFLLQDVSWNRIKTQIIELNQKHQITHRANAFSEKHFIALRVLLTLCFTFIVFWESWTCDDAYHSYIMARHLAEGKGLVYNVGYRVSASTCPLLTLIEALLYKLLHNMEASGIVIGVTTSGAAASVLFFKFCRKFRYAIWAFMAMTMSYCFMSFTTSGLENSLLFLLGALFLSRFFQGNEFRSRDLLILALLFALLAMTRMDTVLIFIPMIVAAFIFMTKVNFAKRIRIGFIGLFPFILWEVFSVFYYGFPFPNTFYAKLFAGYPQSEYIIKGLTYLRVSFMFDCLLLTIPLLFFVSLIRLHCKKALLLFIGLLLYTIYIIRIGGDFMVGRHLTMSFFLAICGVCALLSNQSTLFRMIRKQKALVETNNSVDSTHHLSVVAAVCCLCLSILLSSDLMQLATYEFSIKFDSPLSGIGDEKMGYCKYGAGTIDKIKLKMSIYNYKDIVSDMGKLTNNVVQKIHSQRNAEDNGFLYTRDEKSNDVLFGFVVFQLADETELYLTDFIGLMDPLLARVPGVDCKYWRIGHIERIIPNGYIETVRTGENRIVDPSLHEYYDKMLLIITGDLFDKERLKTIWYMNTGKYDYLLEAYHASLKKKIL